VHAHREIVAARGGERVFPGLAGGREELEGARRAGHQRAGLVDRLAVVQALQLRQFLGAFADAGGNAVQDRGALMPLEIRPGRLLAHVFGGLHGFVDIGGGGCMQRGHGAAVGRVFGAVERAAGIAPGAGHQGLDRGGHGVLRG
jgi:hypothetical protein